MACSSESQLLHVMILWLATIKRFFSLCQYSSQAVNQCKWKPLWLSSIHACSAITGNVFSRNYVGMGSVYGLCVAEYLSPKHAAVNLAPW